MVLSLPVPRVLPGVTALSLCACTFNAKMQCLSRVRAVCNALSDVVAPAIGASRACDSLSALGQWARGRSEPLVHGQTIFFEDLQAS